MHHDCCVYLATKALENPERTEAKQNVNARASNVLF